MDRTPACPDDSLRPASADGPRDATGSGLDRRRLLTVAGAAALTGALLAGGDSSPVSAGHEGGFSVEGFRYCPKCRCLYLPKADGTRGPCAAGGNHRTYPRNYLLYIDLGRSFDGHHWGAWRVCKKCRVVHHTYHGRDRCSVGGKHADLPYGDTHVVPLISMPPFVYSQENGWRGCTKCGLLYWAGTGAGGGTCPAGGAHDIGFQGSEFAVQYE